MRKAQQRADSIIMINTNMSVYSNFVPILIFATVAISYTYIRRRKNAPGSDKRTRSFVNEKEYVPPLPDEIVAVLKRSRLCFLATQSEGEPHLSLMNFTYHRNEELIILSTRRDTKKYFQIKLSPKVAILIHDFEHMVNEDESFAKTKNGNSSYSITLNGYAKVLIDL